MFASSLPFPELFWDHLASEHSGKGETNMKLWVAEREYSVQLKVLLVPQVKKCNETHAVPTQYTKIILHSIITKIIAVRGSRMYVSSVCDDLRASVVLS